MKEVFNLLSFNSTHNAIRAEKELKLHGLDIRIIPVPKEITSGCGLSLKFNTEDLPLVRKILTDKNVEVSGCYYIEKTGLKKEINKINFFEVN